ncbi:hypothetical protein B0H11DRAFT_2069229 [Mycena galericulata]|nr:hypothetical protein B0H11DRAFT_2069229 [Mycena galericulata]
MFYTKAFLATVMLIGTARAFTGVAIIGFTGTASCNCPAFNGPFAASIPAALVGTAVCCNDEITLSYNGRTVPAVFSGICNDCFGTQNVELSAAAFGVLEDNTTETTLSPVTWAFST